MTMKAKKKMPKYYIADAAFLPFGWKAMCLLGDNLGVSPKHFEWELMVDPEKEVDLLFLTDTYISRAADFKAKKKVALLYEPPPFRQCNYDYVSDNIKLFDAVLMPLYNYNNTNGKRIVTTLEDLSYQDIYYYPRGGSMIALEEHAIYPKTKLCSIVVSEKNITEGHKLRHELVEVIKQNNLEVDILGSGYGEKVRKLDALKDYMFSIIVNGEKQDGFFDEKIVDCCRTGTFPIYWGGYTYTSLDYIRLNSVGELPAIIEDIKDENYYSNLLRGHVIRSNFDKMEQFICCEDWMWDNLRENNKWIFE